MRLDLLTRLEQARAALRPVVLATRLPSGEQFLLPDSDAPAGLAAAAEEALQADSSRTVEADGAQWFLHAYNPPLRLVVVGAVHIAQALVPMAAGLGYGVTVADPRRAFASDERFPGVTVSTTTRRWIGRCGPRRSTSARSGPGRRMLPGWPGCGSSVMTTRHWRESAGRSG